MEFKFSIKTKPVSKPKQPKLYTNLGNVIGVCNITKMCGWKVYIPESNAYYDFTRNSYIIRDKKYTVKLYNSKFYSISQLNKLIPNKDCFEGNSIYLPFMAGVICKGTLIRNNITNEIKFELKDTYTDWKNPFAREAITYYRENYDYFYNQLIKENGK